MVVPLGRSGGADSEDDRLAMRRVVDIGAGSGLWTRVMRREFGAKRVVGLDPEPKGDNA